MAYKDKAQAQKVQNEWIAAKYDRINLTVPKGDKEKIALAAALQGQSVNAYINKAITDRMEREATGKQTEAEPKQN